MQALSSAAETSLQLFTEDHLVAPPQTAVGDVSEEAGDSQVLASDCTALPGALEVYLIRAIDFEQVRLASSLAQPFFHAQSYMI